MVSVSIDQRKAHQLYWMSRIAPGFINAQLAKSSKALMPPPESA